MHLDRARSATRAGSPAPLGLDPVRAAAAIATWSTPAWPPPCASCRWSAATTPASSRWSPSGAPGRFTPRASPRSWTSARSWSRPSPGGFSALGLVASDIRRDYARTFYTLLKDARPDAIAAAWDAMEDRSRGDPGTAPACRLSAARSRARADLRYRRQAYELTVPMAPGPVTARDARPARRRLSRQAPPDLRPREPGRAGAARQPPRRRGRPPGRLAFGRAAPAAAGRAATRGKSTSGDGPRARPCCRATRSLRATSGRARSSSRPRIPPSSCRPAGACAPGRRLHRAGGFRPCVTSTPCCARRQPWAPPAGQRRNALARVRARPRHFRGRQERALRRAPRR